MAGRSACALVAIGFASLLGLMAGCSAAGPAGNNSGGSALGTPGCGDGDCSSCGSCVDACSCVTNGDPMCADACAATSGSGGAGPGGSGSTTPWPGAAGSSGSNGGGSNGGGSNGGAGNGGSGGGAPDIHQQAIDRAKAGVGFSYWWGHGRYLPQGPSSSIAGSCSGSCPSCTHSGSYGGDCSGFAAKVWQVPSSNSDLSVDSHPYSTLDFSQDTSRWSTVSRSSLHQADAMVYRQNGAGHIFIYDHGDGWGSMYAYECKGCSYGCTSGMRTASSSYHAIRRTGY